MKELIGKMVVGLRVSQDQSVLTFDHSDGRCTSYVTGAECCSETWFADITGVAALLGGEVLSAECVDLPASEDGRSRQEYDQFYGVKLRTTKGIVDIIFRNSSNGYYGGSIDVLEDDPPTGMVAITDDWRA